MLEKIIASKTKIAILRKMMDRADAEYCLYELTKLTGLSTGSVFPALKDLLESRIIIYRKAGRSNLYKINERHILYNEIKNLFTGEAANLEKIAKDFASEICKTGIISIVLFGSVARKEFTGKSDIDMLILINRKVDALKPKIDALARDYLDIYDVEIVPTVISKSDAVHDGQIKRFLYTISNEGKVLWGEKKWLGLL